MEKQTFYMNMQLNEKTLALFGYTRDMLLDETLTPRRIFFEQLWDNEAHPLSKWARPTICMGGINQGNPDTRILQRRLIPRDNGTHGKFNIEVTLIRDFWCGSYA